MNGTDHSADLERFLKAQEWTYINALAELRRGVKTGHWMWFIFPQIKGLGRSSTAQLFSIRSAEEARAYAAHPVLGARLAECTQEVLRLEGRTAHDIFGFPDELKFRSSMTFFAQTAPKPEIFQEAILRYFNGRPDRRTLAILKDLERP